MANPEHLEILAQGVGSWNEWRRQNPGVRPDLSLADLPLADLDRADLHEADLRRAFVLGANLSGSDLRRADLTVTNLIEANLAEADLTEANLHGAGLFRANLNGANLCRAHLMRAVHYKADLTKATLCRADLSESCLIETDLQEADLSGAVLNRANLRGANLNRADLREANLTWAYLRGADLTEADLTGAVLIKAHLCSANLTDCRICGICAWDLQLEGATQHNLTLTLDSEPVITVDSVEVAQLIHLLLNNDKIREVVDVITAKLVLILGRFDPDRKVVLDGIREELRHREYVPLLLDSAGPASEIVTQTMSTLGRISRFIIADFSEPRGLPHEMVLLVPDLASVAIQPIVLETHSEHGTFEDLRAYPSVLGAFEYSSDEHLLESLAHSVMDPAEQKARQLSGRG